MLPESERPDQQEQSIPTDDANSWFWKPHTLTGKPHNLQVNLTTSHPYR